MGEKSRTKLLTLKCDLRSLFRYEEFFCFVLFLKNVFSNLFIILFLFLLKDFKVWGFIDDDCKIKYREV